MSLPALKENLVKMLFAPFLGPNYEVMALHAESLGLVVPNYHQVKLDTSWQEKLIVSGSKSATGIECLSIVYEQSDQTPLHFGHLLYLLAYPDFIPHTWVDSGLIIFPGVTFELESGSHVAPALRRFSDKESWWLHLEDLNEVAAPFAVAVMPKTIA